MKWFQDEETEKTEQTPASHQSIQERHETNAKTKMTYKYPKQGEFRFPVIPDQTTNRRRKAPSFQPHEEERPKREKRERQPKEVEEESSTKKEEKEERSLPEISSIPFTPTDVPSPIYGYHAREMSQRVEELEEIASTHQISEPEVEVETDTETGSDDREWEELRTRLRERVSAKRQAKPARLSQTEEQPELNDSHIELDSEPEGPDLMMEPEPHEQPISVESDAEVVDEQGDEAAERVENESQQDPHEHAVQTEEVKESLEADSMKDVEDVEGEALHDPEANVQEEVDSPAMQTEDDLEEADDHPFNHVAETLSLEEETEQVQDRDDQQENNRVPAEVGRESEKEIEADQTGVQMPEADSKEEILEPTDEDLLSSSKVEEDPGAVQEEPIQQPLSNESKPKKRTVPFNVIMTPRDKRSRDARDHQKIQSAERLVEEQKKPNEERSEILPKTNIQPETNSKPETSARQETNPKPETPPQEEKKERVDYKTPMHLLDDASRPTEDDDTWIREQMELLETTLRHFHVKAKVVNAMKGPAVTRFEVQPEPGVKVSKITNLSDDIKLSMAARDIRIEAPIPGKQAVGIEVPNHQSQMVGLQEIFESDSFRTEGSPLSVGLGLDIGGDPIVTNLKKMPHGLIAGATGSGKSVCINTILVSLLYKAHYDDVKFLLIDPKMVELAPYNELPHLVSPVITDVKAATTALKWAVKEMEERYEKFVEEGVRDVERYNDKMLKQNRQSEKLPYLVIVIDELADLMMVSPQDVEDAICRIAQKARACGIHLLLATQRPSVDVITGLIKANIPTRIAFSVSSQVDSRTIIDTSGAEKLLGKGDMLFVENGSGQAKRIQGAFVSDDEIERVTSYVKRMAPPQYLFHQEELMKQISSEEETDELFEEAVRFVVEHNGASASLIQRRFKVGYNRAARLIDQMEDFGIISEQKGSKPRDILMGEQQIEELIHG
ncbi:DNA translocase FtsK [Halobacillus litoralis]|uniref:DNA translocase FtsK n=1 Tax=Halobacillus litoralis TaxID=45668 RepID=UPI001CD4C5F7|nr:DNA translocase FtsK [Halobacillus litoralis]MCA0972767.1 DNA translocase FtsK [Halobacillus litoralis]